jgi:hypothetical protein
VRVQAQLDTDIRPWFNSMSQRHRGPSWDLGSAATLVGTFTSEWCTFTRSP